MLTIAKIFEGYADVTASTSWPFFSKKLTFDKPISKNPGVSFTPQIGGPKEEGKKGKPKQGRKKGMKGKLPR